MFSSDAVRSYVKVSRKVEAVRIARTGEVHGLGTIPNTNVQGWFLVGFADDLRKELGEHLQVMRERAVDAMFRPRR